MNKKWRLRRWSPSNSTQWNQCKSKSSLSSRKKCFKPQNIQRFCFCLWENLLLRSHRSLTYFLLLDQCIRQVPVTNPCTANKQLLLSPIKKDPSFSSLAEFFTDSWKQGLDPQTHLFARGRASATQLLYRPQPKTHLHNRSLCSAPALAPCALLGGSCSAPSQEVTCWYPHNFSLKGSLQPPCVLTTMPLCTHSLLSTFSSSSFTFVAITFSKNCHRKPLPALTFSKHKKSLLGFQKCWYLLCRSS